jgi:hypothetical protein
MDRSSLSYHVLWNAFKKIAPSTAKRSEQRSSVAQQPGSTDLPECMFSRRASSQLLSAQSEMRPPGFASLGAGDRCVEERFASPRRCDSPLLFFHPFAPVAELSEVCHRLQL